MNRYVSFFSLLLLVSCTVGPDYRRPDDVPDDAVARALSLKPEGDKIVGRDWYRQFGDPVLNRLAEDAVKDSPQAQIAVQRLREARLALSISDVQYFPTLDADASYHRLKPSKNAGYAIKEDYFQTGLDASWELDIWGAGRRLSESARAAVEAAAANADDVHISLTAEVVKTYVSLRLTEEQLNLVRQNLEMQQKIQRLVEDQAKAGLVSQSELSQTRYMTESLKSQLPGLAAAAEAYRNALAVLSGKVPGDINGLLASAPRNIVRERFEYDLNAMYDLPADTVRRRPDVRAAEQNLIGQNARVGQAVAALYPSVSLSAFLGFQSDTLPKLLRSKSGMFSYSPAIGLPIFHWNALTNQVELEKETTKEYALVYKSTVLNAVGEIKNAMTNVTQSYIRNRTEEAALLNMQDVSVQSFTQYEKGLIPLSSLLSTLQTLLETQSTYISGNAALYQAVAAFYKAAAV